MNIFSGAVREHGLIAAAATVLLWLLLRVAPPPLAAWIVTTLIFALREAIQIQTRQHLDFHQGWAGLFDAETLAEWCGGSAGAAAAALLCWAAGRML